MNVQRFGIATIALTLLVLSGGPAIAQQQPPIACSAFNGVAPSVRAEGLSEQIGDIVVTCVGVPLLPAGAPIPQTNLSISLNVPVTSRLLDPPTRATEALLLVNEPGSQLPPAVNGYGPAAPQILCSTPAIGCAEYTGYLGGVAVPVSAGVATPPPVQAAPNVFQGILTGPNQVTFYGVPTGPSLISGGVPALVFRVTNIRANASATPYGPPGVPAPLTAIISGSNIAISNPVLTAAFVQAGLGTANSILNVPCAAGSICRLGILHFQERFASVFKPRTALGPPPAPQNEPGIIYHSETGFWAPALAAVNPTTATAGLADFGTRLKAVFQVPAGVRFWAAAVPFLPPPGAPSVPVAVLTATESGPFQSIGSTMVLDGLPVVELPVANGKAIAVWEVVTADPGIIEGLDFQVYVSYNGGIAPPQSLVVRQSFAPTADDSAFPALDAGFAQSANYPIPRFVWRPSVVAVPFVLVAPGETGFLHVGLEIPADTSTAITLTSSDPSIANVTPIVIVPAGARAPDRRDAIVTGIRPGWASILASAPGYQSANINLAVGIGIGFMTGPLTISLSSRQVRQLLTLSAPAPDGGLTINLWSDDTRVASVPPAVDVPAGAMTAAVPITAVGTGTTIIHARLMPLANDVGIMVTIVP